MRTRVTLCLLIWAALATPSCGNGTPEPPGPPEVAETTLEDLQAAVVTALDMLASALAAEPPADSAEYTERLRTYLNAHTAFYGSAVALLDDEGGVTSCPYVFRTEDGFQTTDLSAPAYRIENQDWFKMPLEANTGTWTAPYFDAGGGEIWMITRSVLVRDEEGVFAIVTTDLPVDPPGKE